MDVNKIKKNRNIKKRIITLVCICLVVFVGAIIVDNIIGKSYFSEIKCDEIIEKIENKESFVVLISQTTCSHCMSYKPKLEEVANEYKLEIYYIDVDLLSDTENTNLKSYINYDSTPITVFVKNGEETSVATRINGDASKDKIEKKLKSNGFID